MLLSWSALNTQQATPISSEYGQPSWNTLYTYIGAKLKSDNWINTVVINIQERTNVQALTFLQPFSVHLYRGLQVGWGS
jgi:hypothetical protein